MLLFGTHWSALCVKKGDLLQNICLHIYGVAWLRHQMETFSVLLAPCVGNSPVTGELPTQRASNAENASIWWRHE